MAMFVNKPEHKWSREKIAARVYEILARYDDFFDDAAQNKDIPIEDQQIYLDSLDLVEISMELEREFQVDLDLTWESEYFAGNYSPRHFIDFMCKKLNTPASGNLTANPGKNMQQTADKDIDILVRTARPGVLQKNIRRGYGVTVPVSELRALKSFIDYQNAIRRAIAKQNSK